MDAETESQKDINEDNNKELAEGEIADLSGDDSKAADAPETIDLGIIIFYQQSMTIFNAPGGNHV